MKYAIKPLILNNLNLKIISLICGYCLWSMISPYFTIERTYTVPVCFYPHSEIVQQAPESITVTLRGSRTNLNAVCPGELSAHIPTDLLHHGKQRLEITPDMLFLPSSVIMVNYSPSHAYINVHIS